MAQRTQNRIGNVMEILTREEYVKRESNNVPVGNEIAGVRESPDQDQSQDIKTSNVPLPAPPPEVTYFLLHPENPVDFYQNFEDELTIDSISYKRKCINGVVETTDLPLVEFLVSKGYEILDKGEQHVK